MLMIVDTNTDETSKLQKVLARHLPDISIHCVNNGLQALELGHRHAAQLGLVALEVNLPFLDGRFLAAALRRLNPDLVIVPFTASREALPFFAELGCADPIIKPCTLGMAFTQIVSAYSTTVSPPPEAAWFTAMCAQVSLLETTALPKEWRWPMLPSQPNERERLEQARTLLQRYSERTSNHMRGRELAQSIKLLDQCLSA